MGEPIQANWRVLAASLVAAVLVIGAYVLARGVESSDVAQASTETALLQAIAAKDSDNDGLPDWEEALYGTDPYAVDTFNLGMTDGAAVAKGLIVPKAIATISSATSTAPLSSDVDYKKLGIAAPNEGSLTDAFAKSFFTYYAETKKTKGGDLSQADIDAIEQQALDSLSSTIAKAPDYKSASDLAVSGSGPDALRAFAVQAEAIFKKNTSMATTSELVYLQYAAESNDAKAVAALESIAQAYRAAAAGLAVLPVPRELASADLALINAMARVSGIVENFAQVNSDPLVAMMALEQYTAAAQDLGAAFANIANDYAVAGVTLDKGAPGASFVGVSAAAARIQPAP